MVPDAGGGGEGPRGWVADGLDARPLGLVVWLPGQRGGWHKAPIRGPFVGRRPGRTLIGPAAAAFAVGCVPCSPVIFPPARAVGSGRGSVRSPDPRFSARERGRPEQNFRAVSGWPDLEWDGG